MDDARKPIAQLRELAAQQDGQFAVGQARELGCTSHGVQWLARKGETTLMRPGVWRFAAAAGSPDPHITAVLRCYPEGVISHRSAAQQHAIRRVKQPDHAEVTVTHGRRLAPAGVIVHQSRLLQPVDILTVGAIRYTAMPRTIIDLADPTDPWESLAILDDGISAGAKQRQVHQRAMALSPGRPDARFIREATDPDGASTFRSWLERAAAHVYRVAGLPDPEWNVPIHDEQGQIGVVDAVWRPYMVVAEKEGLRFHTTPRQRRADADRFNRLGDAVNSVKRFTWEDVVHRPVHVAATVMKALRAGGADLDPARIPRRIVLPDRPFVR